MDKNMKIKVKKKSQSLAMTKHHTFLTALKTKSSNICSGLCKECKECRVLSHICSGLCKECRVFLSHKNSPYKMSCP